MKKFSIALLLFVSILFALELSLRASFKLFKWNIGAFSPAEAIAENKLWQNQLFSNFLGVHQTDPYFLWKFKPNLNRHIFVTNSRGTLGLDFDPQKKEDVFRILLLGDSSPVGLGLPSRKYAFGEQFLQLLRDRYPSQKFELINASVSGYTSAQGLLWFKKYGVKLKPDLILLYFGNNDASYNGYLQDKELLHKPLWMTDLQNLLSKSAIYSALKGIFLPLKEKVLTLSSSQLRQLTVRVTAQDYYENLRQIVDLTKQNHAKVLLMTVPVPREWPPAIEFKPFVDLKTATGSLVMAEQSRKLLLAEMGYCLDWSEIKQKYPRIDYWTMNVLLQVYSDTGNIDSGIIEYQNNLKSEPTNPIYLNNLSVLYWRKGDSVKSLQYLTQALGQDSTSSILHYNLGMTINKLGDSLAAELEFEKAKELDFYSLRTKNTYNQKVGELSEEYQLSLADLDSLFLANRNEYLFIDHCHPKVEGHLLIAQELLKKFRESNWVETELRSDN
jgi:lysophospholipase L1-like esterase